MAASLGSSKVSAHALQVVALALVNTPEGRSTAKFPRNWNYLLRHRSGKVRVASTLYQASVKGRLALDLETSVDLEGEEP